MCLFGLGWESSTEVSETLSNVACIFGQKAWDVGQPKPLTTLQSVPALARLQRVSVVFAIYFWPCFSQIKPAKGCSVPKTQLMYSIVRVDACI